MKTRPSIVDSGDFAEAITPVIRDLLSQVSSIDHTVIRISNTWQRMRMGASSTGWSVQNSFELSLDPALSNNANIDWDSFIGRITAAFEIHHKRYLDQVGVAGSRMAYDGKHWLWFLLQECWNRTGSVHVTNATVADVTRDLNALLEAGKITRHFVAPLVNFMCFVPDVVVGLNKVTLRKLSDSEFSYVHGGNPLAMLRRHPIQSFAPAEFGLFGEFEDSFYFGNGMSKDISQWESVNDIVDEAILILRTFKVDPIGSGGCIELPTSFFDVFGGVMPTLREYTRLGVYSLAADELPPLRKHVDRMSRGLHPALDIACSRLSDAVARANPRDSLLDAAIGLEAILLHSSDKAELRFRFALNYAWMFDHKERRAAFRKAQELYDIRSQIAHGCRLKGDRITLGKKEYSLAEKSRGACEMLKSLISYFLSDPNEPPFTKSSFWQNMHLGYDQEKDQG